MLISSHFFHGFVSSKKNTQWNLCVLKASAEKKTFFFLSCSIVCFLGQFAQWFKQLRPHVHSEQKRPNIFLQTMVVTSGGLVAAAKLFRYVSFQFFPCLIEADLSLIKRCVASTMCAMTRQAQLRSIHHVCNDKTSTDPPCVQ